MPYFPTTQRDASAILELNLAQQLRQWQPDFDVTRVDLSPFPRIRAKIDCLTISQGKGISGAEIKELNHALTGKVARPNDRPRTATIHDPTQDDLKYLIQEYPTARVDYLELAVDAFLPQGSNDVYLLRRLKEQLRHCIAPQKHERFTAAKRVYWNPAKNRRSHDGSSRPAPLTTVTYLSIQNGLSLKIYLKSIDQDETVHEYCLRTEFALTSAAVEWAGLDSVADLPEFGNRLRTYVSKGFFVGSGFKEDGVDQKKWRKYGASWTLSDPKGLSIQADAQANRRFGDALNEVSRALQRLRAA